MVPAGRMRTLVTVERRARLADDLTGQSAQWEVLGKPWCAVEIDDGNEPVEGQQRQTQNTVILRTHWTEQLAGITPADRVRMPTGEVLGITSAVDPDLTCRELRIVAVRRNQEN